MKPVLLEEVSLKPLPFQFQGTACAKCNKRQSQWTIFVPKNDPVIVCSLCVLYDTVWGRKYGEGIAALIEKVETAGNLVFDRNENANLVKIQDADRILGAIVLTSRVNSMCKKKELL